MSDEPIIAVVHAVVCRCSVAELTDRLTRMISDHMTANRHPDGLAPQVLAEDLVAKLSGANGEMSVFLDEEGDRLT